MVRSCRHVIHTYLWGSFYFKAAREDPGELRKTFPPFTAGRAPMGDVFTSCNWVLRDGSGRANATQDCF